MPLYQWEGSLNVFDRPIAFHRSFIEIAGDVAGAVFLSQLCYWAKRALPEKEFWFYKSVEEWKEETGLSRDQQLRIRAVLKAKDILEEDEARIQHRIYFRLNWEPLVTYPPGGAIPPSRETRHGQVEKPDSAKSENPTPRSRETRFRSSSETTAENTTETTHSELVSEPPLKSTSLPNYAIFRTRFKHVTGIRAGSENGLVALFENLASTYGEEAVLDVIAPWAEQVGKDWLKRNKNYAAKNFLEQDCEDFITSPKEKSKEDSYAHGLEKEKKWKDVDEKFPVRSEQ